MIPDLVLDEWIHLKILYPQLHGWVLRESRRAIGCHATTYFGGCVIMMSSWVWELNGVDHSDLLRTIRHEAAHVIAGFEAKHDPIWKEWAVRLGTDPVTCRQPGSPKMKTYLYVAICSVCGKEYHTWSRTGLVKGKRQPTCACAHPPCLLEFSKDLQVVET
jgi:hypothetical protein